MRVFFALKLSTAQSDALFKFIDKDSSGVISRQELVNGLLHRPAAAGADTTGLSLTATQREPTNVHDKLLQSNDRIDAKKSNEKAMFQRRNSGYMVTEEGLTIAQLLRMIQEKIRARARNDKDVHRNLVQAFKQFDSNGDGMIDRGEFTHTMRTYFALKLSPEQSNALYTYLDKNNDGSISRQELVQGLLHGRSRKGATGAEESTGMSLGESESGGHMDRLHQSNDRLQEKLKKDKDIFRRRNSGYLVTEEVGKNHGSISVPQLLRIIQE
jgi:Ca2+-binding EF-hand superfamily protein